MQTRMVVSGGIAVALVTGTLIVVESQEKSKESPLTVEQWHQEYSGPFLKQMAVWQQLTEDLGMVPVAATEATENTVTAVLD
ncbi:MULTISPECIES: hypothetical protein [unclassified Corynebacterium]|uniref:hypothetical protein n=1 Tax=unclassified Corynebacterium TaxID=2624378 RepID=UPI0029CA07FA|nr:MULTISPECIES: hypothetical protein [unclassified Corynebacterium]WPF65501.1 hypothetical protein OLX12_07910 [Corynebacterium sp. 22KM0430]WPF67997.1 hypothetical protein OLW90_07905 [Corynebacterium sp. 21KM1197]